MVALQPAGQWGWQEVLLNKAVYFLEVLAWSKTKDAQKKNPSNPPKPFTPDFMVIKKEKQESEALDIDELKKLLAKPRVSV